MRRRRICAQAVAIRIVALAALASTTGLAEAQLDSMPPPGGDSAVPGAPVIDPVLSAVLAGPDQSIRAVLTFQRYPTAADLLAIAAAGVQTLPFRALPMVGVQGTRPQVLSLVALPGLRSIFVDRRLTGSLDKTIRSAGADSSSSNEAECAGSVAAIDSGSDLTARGLPFGRAIQNIELAADPFESGPLILEGLTNPSGPDARRAGITGALGAVHSVATGESRLIQIGASGRPVALTALRALDWILQNRLQHGITAICGRLGADDGLSPEDPVNLASKIAQDSGLVVVAGGPADDRQTAY